MSKINYVSLNHLALVTDDLDAAVRDENYPHRHYFLSPGRGGSIGFSVSARDLDLEPWSDDADPVPAAREQV
ncbi:hypothetical protein [Amycolatopsis panacis]|uniref:Uncharacterized protein n=1 Tax=Amycolatopsis panacis TaxID=2340917 RepID=A0A419I2P4_9PSEU|nr:hypothetical protein [Amycolatopsis panacis]RJQ84213.1 hypothetical protein D5S19_17960 [Amycolatopsis panacis]